MTFLNAFLSAFGVLFAFVVIIILILLGIWGLLVAIETYEDRKKYKW